MIEAFIRDPDEKKYIINAAVNVPSVKEKIDWAKKWIESNESFAERLVAFSIVEGLFFSGSFCCIYWLQEQGKMHGLGIANDLIARDEGLHTEFACLLYKNYVKNKLSEQRIKEIFDEALTIETKFIIDSLPCSLVGLSAESMTRYIRHVANRLLVLLGHKGMYNNAEVFAFMDRIALSSKSNFFEHKPTNYKIGNVEKQEDEDFMY